MTDSYSIAAEIQEAAQLFVMKTGRQIGMAMFPKWRKRELMLALYRSGCYCVEPLKGNFVCGIPFEFWERDYIEFRPA